MSRGPIDIGSVVAEEDLFDFLILRESLLESWTTYPFVLHAFTADDGVAGQLEEAGIDRHAIHHLPVEQSGPERCIMCAPDTIFLAETPELWFLDSAELLAPSAEGDNPYAVDAGRLKAPLVRDWLGFVDERGRRI